MRRLSFQVGATSSPCSVSRSSGQTRVCSLDCEDPRGPELRCHFCVAASDAGFCHSSALALQSSRCASAVSTVVPLAPALKVLVEMFEKQVHVPRTVLDRIACDGSYSVSRESVDSHMRVAAQTLLAARAHSAAAARTKAVAACPARAARRNAPWRLYAAWAAPLFARRGQRRRRCAGRRKEAPSPRACAAKSARVTTDGSWQWSDRGRS